MAKKYFKVADKAVVEAAQKTIDDLKAFTNKCDEFAKLFGAYHGCHLTDVNRTSFSGIVFENSNHVDTDIFTVPSLKNHFAVRPRAKAKVKDKAEKLSEIIKIWEEHYPGEINREFFYELLGISWGDILFNGLGYFTFNDAVYVHTGLNLKVGTEILGSEYEAVDEAHRKQKDAA